MIYRVAIPSPLRRLFDYLPATDAPEPSITPGCRVLVPFGRRSVVGVVVAVETQSNQPANRLRPIEEILDTEPPVPATLFQLYLWAARYYQHPVGDALTQMLPALLRQPGPLPTGHETAWQLTRHGKGLPETALTRAPKQQKLLNLLQNGSITNAQIRAVGISRAIIRALADKNLIEEVSVEPTIKTVASGTGQCDVPFTLSDEQQLAVDSIVLDGFQPSLLQGETGSGKTEIYLQAIARVLARGRQALVLVPEINLTPQTVARFTDRFGDQIAVMHSGLTDHERWRAWNRMRTGQAPILIGTRSAVFTPLANPGIIIVDEEHDNAYKQQEGFRYSARDFALMRGQTEKIPVILGSATPSLESLLNAKQGRYQHLRLLHRPAGVKKPQWQLVDIRGLELSAGFSSQAIDAMGSALEGGQQVLVFLNRRGFAPQMLCHQCGWVAECRHCSTRMTTHMQYRQLLCHHCEARQPVPDRCPQCQSEHLVFVGQGTERSESILNNLFPNTPIIRVDRDTTRRKDAMRRVIADVDRGQPCILVGTQMLAKGHHFPNVTLAVLLDIDGGLFSADFRATERMGQLITQVAGRAGRGDQPGVVMLQSHLCDHPLVSQLCSEGYDAFANTLLRERKMVDLPPFVPMALIRAESEHADRASGFLAHARRRAESIFPPSATMRYLGPLPAPMERRQGRYRYQLTVTARSRPALQQLLSELCPSLEAEPSARQVRWSVDVDPADLT
ncbi:MAG: primosomal protein N' [Porticoccaceae bacterium]|nr:primosomal protein N' [Porticoccaceae bacterium]